MKDKNNWLKLWAMTTFVFLNNIIMDMLLPNNNIINLYALWQSSSLMILIVCFIVVYYKLMNFLNCINSNGCKSFFFSFYFSLLVGVASCLLSYLNTTGIWAMENVIHYPLQIILMVSFVLSILIMRHCVTKPSVELKSRDLKVEKCDIITYEAALRGLFAMFLMSLINLNFLFAIGSVEETLRTMLIVILIINVFIVFFLHQYTLKIIYVFTKIKAIVFLFHSVLTCLITFAFILTFINIENVPIRAAIIIGVYSIYFSLFVFTLIHPASKQLKAMELYLKENNLL